MPQPDGPRETYEAHSRQEWRRWLEENHATSRGVWLISYKKTSGRSRVSYDEAVEEALCFGWIDSTANKLDDERYMQYFAPRKRGSQWSALNKRRVERLIAQGRMTQAGLAKIEAAQHDGTWSAYDAVETLAVPPDLEAALAANPAARTHYDAFSSSVKKQLLWWIISAKRPETRARRIEQLLLAVAENCNPLALAAKQKSRNLQ